MLCLDLSLKTLKLKCLAAKHSSAIKARMLPNFHLWNWNLWTMKNGVGNEGAFSKIMILVLSSAGPQGQYNGKYLGCTAIFVRDCLSCLLQDNRSVLMNKIPTILADLSHTPQHVPTNAVSSSRWTVIHIPHKGFFPETLPALLKMISYF